MSTEYLSQTEAATRLGVTRQRIGQLIQDGRIKAKIVAGRPAITDRELARFASLSRKVTDGERTVEAIRGAAGKRLVYKEAVA